MAVPDRRKLAAPVLAQAASFVVVLVIGGFAGHSGTPKTNPTPTPTRSSPAPPASASPSQGKGQQPELTVEVPTTGGIPLDIPVTVLDETARHVVATGILAPSAQSTGLSWTDRSLRPGTYQVCAEPSTRVRFTDRGDGARPGWVCTPVTVTADGQPPVVFHLVGGP
jgi:hypothetical protein